MRTILRGARLWDSPDFVVDIVTQSGSIVTITDAGSASGGDVVDLDGLTLLPGVIDSHVHPIHDETFASVGRAAVFGGVTTICNQLYPNPDETFAGAISRMESEGTSGTADFAAHLRWDRGRGRDEVLNAGELGALSIKVFLAHPDKAVQSSLGDLVVAMDAAKAARIPVLVHAELGDVIDSILEQGYANRDDLVGLHAWRSPTNEGLAIQAAAMISRVTSAQLYIVHASCSEALSAISDARSLGTVITAETCPHYAFLNMHDVAPEGRSLVLPPLREVSDQLAVRKAIASGQVDIVGSDHCGHGALSKPQSISGARAGVPGLEAMLPLFLDAALAEEPWLPKHRLTSVLCEGPAEFFGLSKKGKVLPGYDADLVAVDTQAVTTLSAKNMRDAAGYSLYEGRTLRGAITHVWRRGELVVLNGQAVSSGDGRFVRRAGRSRWT